MVLSEWMVWSLLLIGPALVSGLVSATVSALLARQRRERVFRSFSRLALAITTFGLFDGLLSWSDPDLGSWPFLVLGFADLVTMGALVASLADFTADLLRRPWGQAARVLILVPLAAAVLAIALVTLTLPSWTIGALGGVGAGFLSAVFLTALVCGLRLVYRWREVHDRVFRRILVGTGLLLVAFVPLWFWDLFGHAGLLSAYWFLLIWNLGALVLASRAFFEPPSSPEGSQLFDPQNLEACAARFGLTARETEVAGLHAQGYSAREIGQRLFIAPKTVRNHVSHLYEKTGTGQRRDLLALLRAPAGKR